MRDFVEQIRMVRKMGPLKELLEKFPLFGEMTEQLNPDEKELDKIESMFNSMTEKERQDPSLIQAGRIERIAKGSGRKKEEVKELLQKFTMMQQVMGSIGQNPGILGRIPGFKQMAQLQKLKGTDMSSVLGKDARMLDGLASGMPPGMGMPLEMPQIAPGYTPPMSQAQMARARMMGYSMGPQAKPISDKERDALKEKRKRERQRKKQHRKKK
jgi:signal recognition particle subunit SRP54